MGEGFVGCGFWIPTRYPTLAPLDFFVYLIMEYTTSVDCDCHFPVSHLAPCSCMYMCVYASDGCIGSMLLGFNNRNM